MTRIAALSKLLAGQGFRLRLPTAGASMFPVLAFGDLITVSGLGGEEPRLGEILLVARGSRLWCHRLVRADSVDGCRRYWTRGDAHATADEPVTAAQIVGRVLVIERGRVSASRRALLLLRPVLRPPLMRALLSGRQWLATPRRPLK